MQFFIPTAKDFEHSEQVYREIAELNNVSISDKRIYSLSWRHNSRNMSCSVGNPLPSYYCTGYEPVLAIFDCGDFYKICTQNRGGCPKGRPGGAVLAGKNHNSHVTYFGGDI